MAKPEFQIVVDADVARSSGEAEHPFSSSCRQILNLILNNRHKFVACQTLRQEWKKHASSFSQRWLATMVARKQVVFTESNGEIARAISQETIDEKIKLIAIKDAHLIETASKNGNFIASRDDAAKHAISSIKCIQPIVHNIFWVNPVTDKDTIQIKLKGSTK